MGEGEEEKGRRVPVIKERGKLGTRGLKVDKVSQLGDGQEQGREEA